MQMDLEDALMRAADDVSDALDALLPRPVIEGERRTEARLFEAMRYASDGGKRLRAFMALESATIFGVDRHRALRVAAAVECVHAYSLAHDDLPCMDDDDTRRGRPSAHKAFGEATAVLTGDALQAFAFEVLASDATHENPFIRCQLIAGLASAAGASGMVGGQMIDIEAETSGGALTLAEITRLQRMKTGALFEFCCTSGAMLGHAEETSRRALEGYARDFGLAFQICDDLLDAEGDAEETGKAVGKDAAAGKATFVEALGLESARARAQMLTEQALLHLAPLGPRSRNLASLAEHALRRRK